MRTMTIKAAVALFGVLMACVIAAGPAVAAEFEWRVNVPVNEQRPSAKSIVRFAQRVEERSGGRLKLNVAFANSLGFGEADSLRVLRTGGVEIALVYAGYLSRDLPDIQSALPQGVVLSPQEMIQVMPELQSIYRAGYAKWDTTVLGWIHDSVYDVSVFCKDKVDSLQALKGKKLRVWSKDQIDTFAKLGVSAQIISQNDLYLALQTGVVDCALYVAGLAKTISLQEVTKYAVRLHTYSALPSAVSVSNRHFSRLPKDLQDVLLEAGKWITDDTARALTDYSLEEAARKEFVTQKTVNWLGDMPAADQRAFYEAANDVWAERAKSVGREAPAYRERLTKALAASRGK